MLSYEVGGLRVRSEFELPTAIPIPTEMAQGTDVVIRFCERIEPLENATFSGKHVEAGDRDFAFRAANGLTFRIRDGCEISIARSPEVTDSDVNLFLMGSAWGVLCHQRGLMPIHCSAIQHTTHAFAFTGPSGAGKSTLAAGLAQRGRRHLCDDVCVFDVRDDGAVLRPMPKGLKLWRDATEALDIERGAPVSPDSSLDKFYVSLRQEHGVMLLDVAALYVLEETEGSVPNISRLRGGAHFKELYSSIYRSEWLCLLRSSSGVFGQIAELSKKVSVFRFARPKDMARFNDGLDLVEAHMGEIEARKQADDYNRRA